MGAVERLVAIMAQLRDPEGGCPWDLEQSFASIAPFTLEEAYEVDDAIQRGDLRALREELGDLLLQVVFHARMAQEEGHFDLEEVAQGICEKLVRRHPHVFGDAEIRTAEEQSRSWEEIKSRERRARGAQGSAILGDLPLALPALSRAAKLQRRAERAGFAERLPAVQELPGSEPELGDRLFALVEAARRKGLDAEQALRRANARFAAAVRSEEKRRGA